ncbi:hypothetical protein QCA50_017694 [Cerrena zonata]|uniref:PHD-type domain-containing protein n=1 Tax=Cerrena zonata TaxID=2478898 RepID=A0AAW0FIZ0_9APHY
MIHLSSNTDLITKFNEFEDSSVESKFLYHELKQLKSLIDESDLKFDTSKLLHHLALTENLVNDIWAQFKNYPIITTFDRLNIPKDVHDEINPRNSLNTDFINFLQMILLKSEFNFAIDSDVYEKSSSYAVLQENLNRQAEIKQEHIVEANHEEKERLPMIYCLCREYEYGTMIECDQCNEWYHNVCVGEPEDDQSDPNASEDDSYSCPICKLIDSNETKDSFLKGQASIEDLIKTVDHIKTFKVHPSNELTKLNKFIDEMKSNESLFKEISYKIKGSSVSLKEKISRLKFTLRKLYGAPILIEDLFIALLADTRALLKLDNESQLGPEESKPVINGPPIFATRIDESEAERPTPNEQPIYESAPTAEYSNKVTNPTPGLSDASTAIKQEFNNSFQADRIKNDEITPVSNS